MENQPTVEPQVCQKCGAEMKAVTFRTSLTTMPKRIELHCSKCGTHRPQDTPDDPTEPNS